MESWPKPPTLVFGHRGAPHRAPENTLASFRAALDLGVDGVEFDCHLSKDGRVVIIHDATVDRTTGGRGLVQDLSLEELRRLDAGSWFDLHFAGERVPTLEKALDLLEPSEAIINIEIKSDYRRSAFSGEAALAASVVAAVKERGLTERTLISSFNPVVLLRVKRLEPRMTTALNYRRDMPAFLARGWTIPLVRPTALHPEHSMVTPRYVRWANGRGYRVHVWTPNDPAHMRRLLSLGLDGIITDRPNLLRQVMAETLGT